MKKIFSLLLLCAAVATAPGCKDKNENPQPDPDPVPVPLPEVSDIRATAFANRVVFTWTAPATGDLSNTVIRVKPQSDAVWLIEKSVDKAETSFQITDLDASKTYAYSVQTKNADGELSEGVTGSFSTVEETLLQKTDANDRPLWSIVSFSSQETKSDNGYASNAIDGKDNTFWLSVWNSGDFAPGITTGAVPQYIVIDLKQEADLTEILLYRRNGANSGPTSAKIETTLDDPTENGTAWHDLGTYTLNGNTENGALPCALRDIKTARYVRITVLKVASGTYAGLREVDVKAVNKEEE